MGHWFCCKLLIVNYMCVFVISQNAPSLPQFLVLNYDSADFLMDYDFPVWPL